MVVPTKTNRLSSETSPYLLQHADNPVDWYPWGAEALERAQREDKPILLSVGYAACHWCHVMERECFENPAIAQLMNRAFVCIKVDREERPDIDEVYMAATVAIAGNGGWPMTVFCTPEQTPFFAGTYFPPEDRAGRPGFATLLQRIAALWTNDRDSLFRQAGELCEHLEKQASLPPARGIPAVSAELATGHLARNFDQQWGGFSKAPKFPACQALHLLLRQYTRTGNAQLSTMVTRTLDAMAQGGIYDHVGGGFARYSTDVRWLVPHFEKMLYDNAQLVRVYVEAYQVTALQRYRTIVEETLDYVIREMQDAAGGYYCATDADSEGEEGKFFVFTPKELREALEPEEVRAFCAYYDITDAGNWEGKSIPNTPKPPDKVATELGLSVDELQALLRVAKSKVLALRSLRPAPLKDDKVIAAWNGLMLGAMAEAGRVLGQRKYVESALRAATHLVERMQTPNGGLFRIARNGTAHTQAVLEDYAYVSDGFVDLYEASGEVRWLNEAKRLAEFAVEQFLDVDTGAFFQTAHDHEPLIVRLRDGNDGAMPNAGATMGRVLLRLSQHFDDPRLAEVATNSIRAYGALISKRPHAHLTTLNALEWLQSGALQLCLVGAKDELVTFERALARVFVPERVIAYTTEGTAGRLSDVADGGAVDGAPPALYICRNYTCLAPVTDANTVEARVKEAIAQNYAQRLAGLSLPVCKGRATPEGTRGYLDLHDVAEGCGRPLGQRGLWVSAIGFGTHRVFESVPEHQEALLLALRKGCNLIDTAFGYGGGESERAVGNAVNELVRTGELRREQVVVMTKLSLGVKGLTLEAQLETSLARLGFDCVDVCLLHNPEELLLTETREQTLQTLTQAFAWLEAQVEAGRVGSFGASSNTLAGTESKLSLADLIQCAKDARAQHFDVVQVPLNFLEVGEGIGEWCEHAAALGLSVVTHRPLNAVVDGEVERLFDAPTDTTAPALGSAREQLAALEHEFRAQLGAVLGAVPQIELRPEQLFVWSERVGAKELRSREAWDEFERGALAKELTGVVGAIDRAFEGKQLGQLWRAWRSRYTNAMTTFIAAARNAASEATNRRNAPVRDAFQVVAAESGFAGNLSQMAVAFASSQPGVSSTLVGMRTPRYVLDMVALLNER
jgi:uncharacterized protein